MPKPGVIDKERCKLVYLVARKVKFRNFVCILSGAKGSEFWLEDTVRP